MLLTNRQTNQCYWKYNLLCQGGKNKNLFRFVSKFRRCRVLSGSYNNLGFQLRQLTDLASFHLWDKQLINCSDLTKVNTLTN